jgi:hypothetical protein
MTLPKRLLNISVPLPKRFIVFTFFPLSLKEVSPFYVTAYAGTHCPLSFIFHNKNELRSTVIPKENQKAALGHRVITYHYIPSQRQITRHTTNSIINRYLAEPPLRQGHKSGRA